jgi:hypothetical protein
MRESALAWKIARQATPWWRRSAAKANAGSLRRFTSKRKEARGAGWEKALWHF